MILRSTDNYGQDMNDEIKKYQMVCGIETHVELATKTKIFCNCTTAFGGKPNTHCCEICTGQPGVLPRLNKEVVRLAVRAGLALNCKINSRSRMARKNYFYPDLPKAYQISQAELPVCYDGYVTLDSGKKIGIERIHIEEDAGKLVHMDGSTLVDYNRAGVPLIEIVSRPDIKSPEEAKEYATKLQLILRYASVSDCRMQEGSMRCDVNLSLHMPGEPFGTRTEMKNLSSLTGLAKAMRAEALRQEKILLSGEKVRQATLRYDEAKDETFIMRTKENADDYRYFPEPDIPDFCIPEELTEAERKTLPELPDDKYRRYTEDLGLSRESAGQMYRHKKICDFFEEALKASSKSEGKLENIAKIIANLIIRGLYTGMESEDEKDSADIKVSPEDMAELAELTASKTISNGRALEVLGMLFEKGGHPSDYIKEDEKTAVSDDELKEYCRLAIEENPKAVSDIKNGKEKAINVLFGSIMRRTKGRADTGRAALIIKELINNE